MTNKCSTGLHSQLKGGALLQVNTRIDVGLKYGTQQRELSYGIQAKKSLELSEDGLLSLDMKV